MEVEIAACKDCDADCSQEERKQGDFVVIQTAMWGIKLGVCESCDHGRVVEERSGPY